MNGTNGTQTRQFRGGYRRGGNFGPARFENSEEGKVVGVVVIVIVVLIVVIICICSFCGQGQQGLVPVGDQIQPIAFQMSPGVPVQLLPPQMLPSPELLLYQQNPQYSQQYPQYSQTSPQYTPSGLVGSNPAIPSTRTSMESN